MEKALFVPCREKCELNMLGPFTTSCAGATSGRTSFGMMWTGRIFSKPWPKPAQKPVFKCLRIA